MFCSSCGAKNDADVKFCGGCGSALGAGASKTSSAPAGDLAKKVKGLPKAALIAIAGGLVVVVVLAVVLFSKGGPTEETASDYLITSEDLGDVSNQDKDSTDFTESPIFNSECGANEDLKNALGKGTEWANAGFEDSEDSQNSFWITEQIIGFESEAEVDDVLAAVEDGASDSDCDYSSYSAEFSYDSPYESAESLGDVDLPGNGWFVRNDTEMTMGLTTVTSEGSYLFAKRGKVLAIMSIYQGDTSYDEDLTTYDDLMEIAKTVLARFNG